ncbi:MAG: hypothetical protein CMJ64_17880 [Planctomycetaceae bacterium]|jgi:hypothetical protein|nr:hypothetical protein [Planctomycetaceae bacterium]
MTSGRKQRWWQFSLKQFLLAVVVVGPILGFLGPPVFRSFFEWSPSGDVVKPGTSPTPRLESRDAESYYESGETPLY